MTLLLVVAVALIDPDDRVLISQRPAGKTLAGLWEFPGGKLEPGESPAPLTFASHGYQDKHLLMPLYVCRRWQGTAKPLENQVLRWVHARKLRDFPMPPADAPLIPALIDLLG